MSDFSGQDAQSARRHWFNYLDAIEPVRADLHRYCLSLTRNIWDAEDLLQETLLRGFGMTARGDLHGEFSPMRNAKAYLFRVASNRWIDQNRRNPIPLFEDQVAAGSDSEPIDAAIEKALMLSSPQEFAALILKEGFDFTLEEIADFVVTTPGTVKSALSRARKKMQSSVAPGPASAESKQLAKQFAEAINNQDLDGLMQLMSETMSIVVCNVGGGRGRSGVWTEKSVQYATADHGECEGEAVVIIHSRETGRANDVVKIEASGGVVTRLTDYCYAPETLNYLSTRLGIEIDTMGYHQSPETLVEMIATTGLPWRE